MRAGPTQLALGARLVCHLLCIPPDKLVGGPTAVVSIARQCRDDVWSGVSDAVPEPLRKEDIVSGKRREHVLAPSRLWTLAPISLGLAAEETHL